MRRWSLWAAVGLLTLFAAALWFRLPGQPFARPGGGTDTAEHTDEPNRAEDDIPGENTALATLPRAATEGNQPLPYRLAEDGVKVFDLTARAYPTCRATGPDLCL